MPANLSLALLADCYIPLLLLGCVYAIARAPVGAAARNESPMFGLPQTIGIALLLSGLLIAFGLGWLDRRLGFWPGLGMDYSTHTAVALALGLFLLVQLKHGRWLGLLSLPGYGVLMGYLGYHSAGDMLSTSAAITLLYGPLLLASWRYRN